MYLAFIIIGLLFTFSIIIQKTFMEKLKNSGFVALIAVFLIFYVISAFLICLYNPNWKVKLIMLFFTLSPFIIGKFATYKYEKIFTSVQIITILLSVFFVSGVLI